MQFIFDTPACVLDDYLVVSDLHLGYEYSLNDVEVVDYSFNIIHAIRDLLDEHGLSKLIINGDIKHPLFNEMQHRIQTYLSELSDYTVILIRGNHDSLLKLKMVDFFVVGDTTVTHGHKLIPINTPNLLLAHTHPALRVGNKTYKVWVTGRSGFEFTLMPSFSPLITGSESWWVSSLLKQTKYNVQAISLSGDVLFYADSIS